MFALNHIAGSHGHIVAQIVETEFVVCSECDVAVVGCAACRSVGIVFVDAVNGGAVEHIERTHPLGVTFRQVVVDGHHVYAAA